MNRYNVRTLALTDVYWYHYWCHGTTTGTSKHKLVFVGAFRCTQTPLCAVMEASMTRNLLCRNLREQDLQTAGAKLRMIGSVVDRPDGWQIRIADRGVCSSDVESAGASSCTIMRYRTCRACGGAGADYDCRPYSRPERHGFLWRPRWPVLGAPRRSCRCHLAGLRRQSRHLVGTTAPPASITRRRFSPLNVFCVPVIHSPSDL